MGAPRSALKCLSAQPTGPGLAASKKRKSAKPASCQAQPDGISQRISQKASTSSQTMAPGSGVFMCRAVTVQAQMPMSVPTSTIQPQGNAPT